MYNRLGCPHARERSSSISSASINEHDPRTGQKIDKIFHAAIACEPAQLNEFLDEACAGDQRLRLDLESLISSHQMNDSFIESPPGHLAAELLGINGDQLKPGHQIGNYEIVRQLGAGGMGEVYLADDTRLNRKIALKVLPPHFTINPDRARRFEQEARAASALNHPNILTIFEIGQSDHAHFIAAEFVDGKTLRQLMNEKPFTLGEALSVVIQVAGALTAAHAAGIVHRDIKPENIMVRADGYAKILDFGLAKLTESSITNAELETPTLVQSSPGLVLGTVQYMSPEQARARGVTVRTDIWSLGIVLYELLAGRVPFSGETPSHVMVSLMEDDLPPLARYADVPPALNCIVTRALRKNQKERYGTASQLADDLKTLKLELRLEARFKRSLETVPSNKEETAKSSNQSGSRALVSTISSFNSGATYPASNLEQLVAGLKRHKTLLASAFVVIVILTVFGSWFLRRELDDKKEINSIAVMPFLNETGSSDAEYLSDGIIEALIGDLAQLPQLRVTAGNSTFQYKGKEIDPREAGRSLGVEAIFTGRISRRDDSFLISVELISARDATPIWSERYNRRESELPAAQVQISQAISQALRVRLTTAEERQLAKRQTADPKAYELLLKSRYLRREGGTEDRKHAIELLQEAIVADPKYALAYADLSDLYGSLVNNNVLDQKEFTPRSEAAALKALALNNDLAEAHLAMATVKTYHWDWAAAEREYKRAIDLNPSLTGAHDAYASFLMIQGKGEQALIEARRAKELDPVSTGSNVAVVYALLLSHQTDEALAHMKRIVELNPGSARAQSVLAQTYGERGQYRESLASYQASIRLGDVSPDAQIALGTAYAKVGQPEKTRAILRQLRRGKEYVSPLGLAVLHVALHEYEPALALLELAYSIHDQQLIWIGIESIGEGDFARVASDPRFVDLMQRMDLNPPV
jgi:eukaryotic-like serine/threonine-protein kinase